MFVGPTSGDQLDISEGNSHVVHSGWGLPMVQGHDDTNTTRLGGLHLHTLWRGEMIGFVLGLLYLPIRIGGPIRMELLKHLAFIRSLGYSGAWGYVALTIE